MKRIFVFGSNKLGIHGAGAAKFALLNRGAYSGIGEGMSGDSYALPTKFDPWSRMNLNDVHKSINKFLAYAFEHHMVDFQITQVGCGLGGFTKKQIAPLFAEHTVLLNCYFDKAWQEFLPAKTRFWGSF